MHSGKLMVHLLVWPADVPDLDVGILKHMISLIDAFWRVYVVNKKPICLEQRAAWGQCHKLPDQ